MHHVRKVVGSMLREKPLVRVLPLVGTIKSGRGKKNLNLMNLEKQIAKTFDCEKIKPKAVVLEINSGGGSAVQSNLIYNRIRNLAEKNDLPVISFVEDVAASGGYWLSLAGDEIYADPNSAVGSIGALSVTFGVQEVLKKLGLEPRIVNAGKHKLRINVFEEVKPEDRAWLSDYLNEVHENFINLVKERRANLQADHKTVFEADVFTGTNAAKIGLIDGTMSDINAFIKKRYGDEVVIKRMEGRKWPFGLDSIGAKVEVNAEEIMNSLADTKLNSRFKTF